MVKYKRLTLPEREEISRYLTLDYSYRQIARRLQRAPSTIQREITGISSGRWDYRAVAAENKARTTRQRRRYVRKLDQNDRLREFVLEHLKKHWSPQQIVRRLKLLYSSDMHISHETIYAYVYVQPRGKLKRRLIQQLRRKHKNRRPRKTRLKCRPIQDFISIDQRPDEINQRQVIGHWEGDLVMGPLNKSAIGTLVERVTRLTLLVKLSKKDATSVRKAFEKKFNALPESLRKSLTYDQGQEMAEHKLFTEATRIQVYFAHPHSPWERGTCENTNMLIRDFFPKGTDFSRVSAAKLQKVQDLLNGRPRRVLSWFTPYEVFTQTVALDS